MSSISTRSKRLALLAVASIALAACGGSSENSNTASTVALGVKNAAPVTTSTSNTTATVATACAAGGACVVGDTGPGGGKVFYVAPTSFTSTGSACDTKCNYLEAAPVGWIKAATPAGQTNCAVAGTSTADPKCGWLGNTTTRIGTTSNAIGAGYANTSAIITQSNVAGRAATVARAFQGGGKTDWFLPSKDELTQVYLQKSILGGFDFNYYWSSSELDASKAWMQGFDGYGDNFAKTNTFYVRPVRAFSGSTTVAATTTTVAATTLTCAAGGACVVGDTGPGGGKVFYVAPTSFTSTVSACAAKCKYLEAAPTGWNKAATPAEQFSCFAPGTSTADPKCVWSGNTTTRIGTTQTGIGSGYANTLAMIAQIRFEGRAATLARAFQGGGKADWYLPSKDELTQMYLQRSAIGGLASGPYWSSSEYDANVAWLRDFNYEQQGSGNKSDPFYVRPVRAFSRSATGAAPVTTSTSTTTTTVAATTTTVAATTTTVAATTSTVAAITLTCAAGGACRVGDTGPGGGKVFYVASTSFTSTGSACGSACKYLEAAPAGWITAATPAGQTNCAVAGTGTADPQCAWSGNTATRIGTTQTGIGSGYANTSAIIAQSNVAGRAATVARAFQGGGKADWYLPSKDELDQVYLQRSAIGGFAPAGYSSSSEYRDQATIAWFQSFYNGKQSYMGGKTVTFYVRPVRAF